MESIKKKIGHFSAWAHSTFGNYRYQKFVIVTRSRTGSTLLVHLLASHPNIVMGGERFQRLKGKDAKDVWHKTFAKKLHYVKAVGFKIFYYHPCGLR